MGGDGLADQVGLLSRIPVVLAEKSTDIADLR
jgi:hypothetical protein